MTLPPTHDVFEAETSFAASDPQRRAITPERPARSWATRSVFEEWTALHSKVFLTLLVLCCLLPFIGKAFNIDDPVYIWQAKQIIKHPLDPYGFRISWFVTEQPYWKIGFSPPLVCYYEALAGLLAGWSERALHLAFLIPALVLALGTYQLARRFTKYPLVAAAAAFLTPGVLVSGTSVMTDIAMVAIWVLAAIFWIEGIDSDRPLFLFLAVSLMAASALTKYFGMSLIPLAFAYGFARSRRLGTWVLYLLVPVLVLVGYEFWTHLLYGRGLIWSASQAAGDQRSHGLLAKVENVLVCLSYAGGTMLPGLTFAPVLWSRRQVAGAAVFTALFAGANHFRFVDLGLPAGDHYGTLSLQLACFTAGGISILALLISDFRRHRDANSAFLGLWILGTLAFVAFLNWTVSVRTILPLIPAAGILLARRLEQLHEASVRPPFLKIVIPLLLSSVLSLWIAVGDADLANSARMATREIQKLTQRSGAAVLFEGHWGFQHYMELSGARPIDVLKHNYRAGDFLVLPKNNTNVFGVPPGFRAEDARILELNMLSGVTIMHLDRGAGFYSSLWGPLPFAFGPVPPEQYFLVRLAPDQPTP